MYCESVEDFSFLYNHVLMSVCVRSNRNERTAQMEHHHHSGLDELDVSKRLVETFC